MTSAVFPRVERPYGFRRRLEVVHRADRRDESSKIAPAEIAIGTGWTILVDAAASRLVFDVAKDLQDYLLVSMQESVLLRRVEGVAEAARTEHRVLVLATAQELAMTNAPATPRSYRLTVSDERIVVCGADDRGAAQGSYHLEDLMNLRGGPYLERQNTTRAPIFAPRMTHSGWGLDEYPDAYLNAVAHAGMDSILVFVTGVDRTPDEHTNAGGPGRYRDLDDLVERAARYGLDVYFYAYFHTENLPHPEAPGSEEAYEALYGAVFRHCPRAKGIILVGESIEFPSRDPRTTGRHRLAATGDGLPADRPSPGWWPCVDYPQWVGLVARVVRRHNPGADIVFWTYNWGYAPEEERLRLIRDLPTGITLQVTFEMFEPIERGGAREVSVDYTAAFEGPGAYFRSEAIAAHRRGIRLYAMSNTGGLTWDFGDIPYEPVPYQWSRRHAALKRAHEEWGLTGLMESHHYGWWPSFVSELAKWAYWSPGPPAEDVCAALAARDFGAETAPVVLQGFRDWSEALRDHYVPTNEDQYGPFRIGPSYPLIFGSTPKFPVSDHAMFGDRIFFIDYRPAPGGRLEQSVGAARIGPEIQCLRRMAEQWNRGLRRMRDAEMKSGLPAASDLVRLGAFILSSIRTTIHVKEWSLARQRLFVEDDPLSADKLLDDLLSAARRELANAESALPLVQEDSRLGWEPSMEYVCGPDQLKWKIRQVRRVIDSEIPAYRARLHP